MKYIKNLAKMLFKSWVVALALAMIWVGLIVSFDKHPTADLSLNNLFVMTFSTSIAIWLFVFALLVLKKAMKGKPGFAGVTGLKFRRFGPNDPSYNDYMSEIIFNPAWRHSSPINIFRDVFSDD